MSSNSLTSEVLNHGESSKDDPVGEPLGVVVLHGGLQGPDGAVSWIGKSEWRAIIKEILLNYY